MVPDRMERRSNELRQMKSAGTAAEFPAYERGVSTAE